MTIHDFSRKNSILNQFISELRDENFQKNKALFRNNIARIGEILSYELSKTLTYKEVSVITPLGIKNMNVPADQIVLCSVMRAGIALHHGILNYFDSVENAFISAYRLPPTKDGFFEVEVNYFASPHLEG